MRWHELSEAPIDIHQIDYPDVRSTPEILAQPTPPDLPDSFRGDDRKLLQNPKAVEKIKRIWHASVADVVVYFVNVGWEPDRALDLALYGHDANGENGSIADLHALDIDPTPGKIGVIFSNNEGAARLPMTGWIIAHRLYHAIDNSRAGRYHGGFEGLDSLKAQVRKIETQNDAVLADLRGIYNDALSRRDFAETIGSTRACRERKLNSHYELMPECFAQYMLKGRVTLRELPPEILSQNKQTYTCYQGNFEFANREVKSYEGWLNEEMAKLIDMCKGRIFGL